MARTACPVFISYARRGSAAQAKALVDRLGDRAFLDTKIIKEGDDFPQHLLDALLDARVVVIFATQQYSESRFCRLEMRLALAGGAEVVLALGKGSGEILSVLPTSITRHSFPKPSETDKLIALVEGVLPGRAAIRERLSDGEARRLSTAFLEESHLRPPHSLHGVTHSFPEGAAVSSIGERFVGRVDLLRKIHLTLSKESGGAAQLTGRITAGGGFGKTRLAAEYAHRYGATHYRGGVFWVDASSNSMSGEYWRVLRELNPATPQLKDIPDVKESLRTALRRIEGRVLWVVDNIPEAKAGESPLGIHEFCPAVGDVAVLATSRQTTAETHVRRIEVDTLEPDAAVLLLTHDVREFGELSWPEWKQIAEWVGFLPIALDLLNASLVLGESPRALFSRVDSGTTEELDGLAVALKGQVPPGAVRGVSEVFRMSVDALDEESREVAMILAELGPTPIPMVVMEEIPEASAAVRMALRSRHFVTAGGELSFGVMHRLMGDYLRGLGEGRFDVACEAVDKAMTADRCKVPGDWPSMRLCRPHAEALFKRSASDTTPLGSSELGQRAAMLARVQGDWAGALRLEEAVLEVRAEAFGRDHPHTLSSMNSLVETLWAKGDYAEAGRLGTLVVEGRTIVLGAEHPDTLTSMNNLAETLRAKGDLLGARFLHERVLELKARVLGEEHPSTLRSMNNLAWTLWEQGNHAEAQQLQERVLEVRIRLLGEEHLDSLLAMNSLACTLRAQGDYMRARQLGERVLETRIRVLGEEHPSTLTSMINLAVTLAAAGDLEGALRFGRACLESMRQVLGETHPYTVKVAGNVKRWEAATWREPQK
jgi:tetratricopeptide (TPR) repeat protein